MPYALRTFTCVDCGKPAQGRRSAATHRRCHPCAIDYAAECARQMHAKDGPIYVRWVWAQATAYARMAKRLAQAKQSRAA